MYTNVYAFIYMYKYIGGKRKSGIEKEMAFSTFIGIADSASQ